MIQEIKRFVARAIVAANDAIRRCVDGRYKADDSEARGGIAMPGGDLGLSMSLLSIKNEVGSYHYTPQQAFDLVYDLVTSKGQKYYWHTDDHSGEDGIGCGHCNAASSEDNQDRYQTKAERVTELHRLVYEAWQMKQDSMVRVVLEGNHGEQGILQILGTEWDVMPQDENGQQFFIWSSDRHQAYVRQFAETVGIDPDLLWKATAAQLNATLGLLGSSQGKPIYSVDTSGVTQEMVENGELSSIENALIVKFTASAPDFSQQTA